MKKIFLPLIVLFLSITVQAQVITISQARSKTVGTEVIIKGIVTNGDELGLIRYMQDNTAGIGIYSSKLSGVEAGDSIEVKGTLKEFNNLLEIDPVDYVTVLSSNNPLPAPKILSLTNGFTEAYEGQLVKFVDVSFTSGGTFSGNTNYNIQKDAVQKQIRINSATNLVGEPIPSSQVSITGIMSQYFSTYQLLPRSTLDISAGSGPNINSELIQTEINTNSFRISFTTQNPGNTIIEYGLTRNLEIGFEADAANTTTHSIVLDNLQPATFYYVRAHSLNSNGDTSSSGMYYFSTKSESSGRIITYFNRSVDTSFADLGAYATTLNRTIDDTLVAYIFRAKQSIDLAVYNLNNTGFSANITDALNNAYDRGLRVRIVADGGTAQVGLNNLRSGIGVIKSPGGSSYGLMHNKFFVFDVASVENSYVWTGSTNLTEKQVHEDPNSVVIIQDQALAKAYTVEFEEMFGSTGATPSAINSKFGPFKTDNIPHYFNIGGNLVELYFSPSDGTTNKIIDAIQSADREFFFSTFVFTRDDLADAVEAIAQNGVNVKGIMGDVSNQGNEFSRLKAVLDTNLLDGTGQGYTFHHKYAFADVYHYDMDPLVIVGSHNWSSSAETRNDENTLIIHDDTTSRMYLQEFAQRFKEIGGVITGITCNGAAPEIKFTNPVNSDENLLLWVRGTQPGTTSVNIYDLNGRIIKTTSSNSSGDAFFNISLNGIKTGIYLVQVKTSQGISTGKLLVR